MRERQHLGARLVPLDCTAPGSEATPARAAASMPGIRIDARYLTGWTDPLRGETCHNTVAWLR